MPFTSAVYFVNWQRRVLVEERHGQKVVVKYRKPHSWFNEYLLSSTYTAISLLLAHPSTPPSPENIQKNEGQEMRSILGSLGIRTPRLVSMSDGELVEEYVPGGDLYRALVVGAEPGLAFHAGLMTGRLHNAGRVFTDNKAQNYLVSDNSLLRTDLSFIQKSSSTFARSMDIGSFLASVIDLHVYSDIEMGFYCGYRKEASKFPYLSLVIRNILSAGFSSDSRISVKNMMLPSSRLLG